jgi:glycosyltransferase involved in cell wall biosynthesis
MPEPTPSAAVIHVPYTYFPDASGGTEVFVRMLAQRLASRGFPSAIAAPAPRAAEYEDAGLAVHRFAVDARQGLAGAYGMPDETAAAGFAAIVARLRPRIVHLHARTSAVSERLIDIAQAAGAAVVLTYHTPTVSCARGTMMLLGRQPCDGAVGRRRCVTCALAGRNVAMPLARLAAAAPAALTHALAAWPVEARPLSRLRVPGLLADGGRRFGRFIGKVDHVVAVCQWVRDVLRRNGVPDEKITLSRQGIDDAVNAAPAMSRPAAPAGSGTLRIGYFGRIDATKGPDLLAEALSMLPGADVRVHIHGILQAGAEDLACRLRRQSGRDPRLQLLPAVPPSRVRSAMAECDIVAVPSRWLETGPLVALEAFAAGVPVLGANHGGIAELVRDGVDGVLVPPDDAAQWAAAIGRLAADRALVARLGAGIAPPRTAADAADDMAALYTRLLMQPPARG